MKFATLFSGGKDSTWSLYFYMQQGWDPRCLITVKSKNRHSWMFHTPNINLAQLQADALQIPLLEVDTLGEKEEELNDLKKALQEAQRSYKIEAVVTGAIASDYQQERVNRVCEDLGLKTFSPLWHKNQERLVQQFIDDGFSAIIQSVSADGLGEEDLGKALDSGLFQRLKALKKKVGLSVSGEGGEFETLVLDGPIFHQRIHIEKARKVMESKHSGILVIEEASLEKKKK